MGYEDNDVPEDVDQMMLTPKSIDEDNDVLKDVNDMMMDTPVTPLIDDDEIDKIANAQVLDNDDGVVGDINNLMQTPLNNDMDVIDNLTHEGDEEEEEDDDDNDVMTPIGLFMESDDDDDDIMLSGATKGYVQ